MSKGGGMYCPHKKFIINLNYKNMKITPFKGFAAVRPEKDERTSAAGLSYQYSNESNGFGELISINSESEKFTSSDIGRRVLYVKYPHSRLTLNSEEFCLVDEKDILGYIEN